MSYIPSPPKDSPEFTGVPKAPTPEVGDVSNKIATTEHVKNVVDTLPDPVALTLILGS